MHPLAETRHEISSSETVQNWATSLLIADYHCTESVTALKERPQLPNLVISGKKSFMSVFRRSTRRIPTCVTIFNAVVFLFLLV